MRAFIFLLMAVFMAASLSSVEVSAASAKSKKSQMSQGKAGQAKKKTKGKRKRSGKRQTKRARQNTPAPVVSSAPAPAPTPSPAPSTNPLPNNPPAPPVTEAPEPSPVPLPEFSGPISEPVCEAMLEFSSGEQKKQNCEEAFRRVPNPKALRWALEYFVGNQGRIKDATCFLDSHEIDALGVNSEEWVKAAREKGISTIHFEEFKPQPREEWIRMAEARKIELKNLKADIAARGIENGCQFMLNDFSEACAENAEPPRGYWIDLCAAPESVVRPLKSLKLGTGTCKFDFRDQRNLFTTVPGAFLTGELSDFESGTRISESKRKYDLVKRAGILKKVLVFGMHETNNDTFWDKHVHVSPLRTSGGCPAIDPADVDVIYEMGKSQTLVVNYGPEKFHPPGDSCRNLRKEDQ